MKATHPTHTPGPWRCDGTKIIRIKTGNVLADLVDNRLPWEANARLIAAAPELADLARWIRAHDAGRLEDETDDEWHDRLADWHAHAHRMACALLDRIEDERRKPSGDDIRAKSPSERTAETLVIVNGGEWMVSEGMVTYEHIIKLAGTVVGNVDTVTFRNKADSLGGILRPGESVAVENGMAFNTAATDGA